MENKQEYLLTFLLNEDTPSFVWFKTKKEMLDYANNNEIHVLEMLRIKECEIV